MHGNMFPLIAIKWVEYSTSKLIYNSCPAFAETLNPFALS